MDFGGFPYSARYFFEDCNGMLVYIYKTSDDQLDLSKYTKDETSIWAKVWNIPKNVDSKLDVLDEKNNKWYRGTIIIVENDPDDRRIIYSFTTKLEDGRDLKLRLEEIHRMALYGTKCMLPVYPPPLSPITVVEGSKYWKTTGYPYQYDEKLKSWCLDAVSPFRVQMTFRSENKTEYRRFKVDDFLALKKLTGTELETIKKNSSVMRIQGAKCDIKCTDGWRRAVIDEVTPDGFTVKFEDVTSSSASSSSSSSSSTSPLFPLDTQDIDEYGSRYKERPARLIHSIPSVIPSIPVPSAPPPEYVSQ